MSNNTPEIILASGSAARKMMLDNAGVSYMAIPADIDEQAIIDAGEGTIAEITQTLAQNKALHIAQENPDAIVIGSDQTLEFEGQILSKAKNVQDARGKLRSLRGNTHYLHSAVSVVRGDHTLFTHIESAELTMHDFDDAFLDTYMQRDPDALLSCVGGYKIEGAGAWLFSSIKGDNFTIMGMPLLPLLCFLREEFGVTP